MTPARRRLLLGAALVAAVATVAWNVDARTALGDSLTRIERLGAWGVVLFVALYVVATVLFLPGSILTLGAGAIFGLAQGVAIAWTAATLGAAAAFLVGRYLARDAVARALAGSPRFRALDAAVAREGWKIVALMRLSPVFPFNVLNYGFGITRVPFIHYTLASWIGMLPGALVYVYLGSLAGDLATLGDAASPRAPARWGLTALGLVATVAVSASIARLARRALARRIAA